MPSLVEKPAFLPIMNNFLPDQRLTVISIQALAF
jgi:hypothetical protein